MKLPELVERKAREYESEKFKSSPTKAEGGGTELTQIGNQRGGKTEKMRNEMTDFILNNPGKKALIVSAKEEMTISYDPPTALPPAEPPQPSVQGPEAEHEAPRPEECDRELARAYLKEWSHNYEVWGDEARIDWSGSLAEYHLANIVFRYRKANSLSPSITDGRIQEIAHEIFQNLLHSKLKCVKAIHQALREAGVRVES